MTILFYLSNRSKKIKVEDITDRRRIDIMYISV